MADDRTYIRVHDGIDENPKIVGLSHAAFRLLIESWAYCSRNLTDGVITDAAWKKRGTPKARLELVAAGLVDEGDGYVQMHDYLEHQRSAAEVAEFKAKRKKAGAIGNHNRHHVEKGRVDPACELCQSDGPGTGEDVANASHGASDVRSQNGRKLVASTEAEAEADLLVGYVRGGGAEVDARDEPPLYPDRCKRHGNTYEPGNCGGCADTRKANQRHASVGAHNRATKPHCGECDETRMLRTRFGAIPCPNCNPAAEAS